MINYTEIIKSLPTQCHGNKTDDGLTITINRNDKANLVFYVGPDEWDDNVLTITDDGYLHDLLQMNQKSDAVWDSLMKTIKTKYQIDSLALVNEILLDTTPTTINDDITRFIEAITYVADQLNL